MHLGPDDLPVEAVREVAPEGFLIGHSTDRLDLPDKVVGKTQFGMDLRLPGKHVGKIKPQRLVIIRDPPAHSEQANPHHRGGHHQESRCHDPEMQLS